MCTEISLKICDTQEWTGGYTGASVARAIDLLNEKFQKHEIQTVSLTGKRTFRDLAGVLRYRVIGIGSSYKSSTVSGLEISSSYFVGQADITTEHGPVSIRIKPDLPDFVRNHLLNYACGVYLPQDLPAGVGTNKADSFWMLLLMWRCAFEQAVRLSSVPRAYVPEEKNLRFFRGRLDVVRQIQENLTDQSRFYCRYAPLSMDITINRVIRYVFKLAVNCLKADKAFLRPVAAYDEMLAAFGVGNSPVTPAEIDRISYHRMNAVYRPLMQLSKLLIRHLGAGDCRSSWNSMAYFVDWTEIWENYLLKVLQKHLPDYTIVSPNESLRQDNLLECGRTVRPDFLVYQDGALVAVMDAKYKNYTRIGASASEPGAVSREDLYQMTAYLYHYAGGSKNIPGIFLSKGSTENDSSGAAQIVFTNGKNRIALAGLDISQAVNNREQAEKKLAEAEENFATSVKQIIESDTGKA